MATQNSVDIGVVPGGGFTYTFPGVTDTIVTKTSTDILTNKTLTSPTINTPTLTAPILGVASATSITLSAGTTSVAPINLAAGTNLTSVTAGVIEPETAGLKYTIDTTNGRGLIPVEQRFRLTATGGTITTIANYFGTTSNIPLVSGGEYEIEIECYFLKTTAAAVTFTFTNTIAPTSMAVHYELSAIAGIVTTAAATYLFGDQYNITATAPTVVTGTLATGVNHRAFFKIRLINSTGTSLKIQATSASGSITPGINSSWVCRRVPASNVGTFAA